MPLNRNVLRAPRAANASVCCARERDRRNRQDAPYCSDHHNVTFSHEQDLWKKKLGAPLPRGLSAEKFEELRNDITRKEGKKKRVASAFTGVMVQK